MISASADKTVAIWDAVTGTRMKKFVGHTGVVNSVCPNSSGSLSVVSGSDDGLVNVWDARSKFPTHTLEHDYPVTAVAYGQDGVTVYSGNLDGSIKSWDLRMNEMTLEMKGHTDIITSLALNPAGTHLMSNGMDSMICTWDIRAFVAGDIRRTGTYWGAKVRNLKCS